MASDNEDDDLDALREAALATLKQKVKPIENVFSGSCHSRSQDPATWSDVPASMDFPTFSDPIPEQNQFPTQFGELANQPPPPQHLFRPTNNLPWNPSHQNRMPPFQNQRMRHPRFPHRSFGAMADRGNRRRGHLPPGQMRGDHPPNDHFHQPHNMSLPQQAPGGANLIVIQPNTQSNHRVAPSSVADSAGTKVNSVDVRSSQQPSGDPSKPKLMLPQDKYHSTENSTSNSSRDTEPEPKPKSKDKFSRYDKSDSEEEEDDDLSEVDDIANEIDKVLQDDFLAEEIKVEETEEPEVKDDNKKTDSEEEKKNEHAEEHSPSNSPVSEKCGDEKESEVPKSPADPGPEMSDISDSESVDLDALVDGEEPVIGGDLEDLDSLVDKEPELSLDVNDNDRPVIDGRVPGKSNESEFRDNRVDKNSEIRGSGREYVNSSDRKSPLHMSPNNNPRSSPSRYRNSDSPSRKYGNYYSSRPYPSPRRSRSPLYSKAASYRRSASPRPPLRPRSRSPNRHRSPVRRSSISPRRRHGSPGQRKYETSPRRYPIGTARRRSSSPTGRTSSPYPRDLHRPGREGDNRGSGRDDYGARQIDQRYRDFDRSRRDRDRLRLTERDRSENQRLQDRDRSENQRLPERERSENQRLPARDRSENQRLLERDRSENQRLPERDRSENQRLLGRDRSENQRLPARDRSENLRLSEWDRSENQRQSERDRFDNQKQLDAHMKEKNSKISSERSRTSPLMEKNTKEKEVKIDLEKLTPAERAKIEARKRKFDSKSEINVAEASKKISLKDIKKREKKAKKKEEEKVEEAESLTAEEVLPDAENKKSSKSGISLKKLRKKQVSKKQKGEEEMVEQDSPKAIGIADLEESEEDSDEDRSWRKESANAAGQGIKFGISRTMVKKPPLVSLDSIGQGGGRRCHDSNRTRFPDNYDRRSHTDRSRGNRSQRIHNNRWSSDEDSDNGGFQTNRLSSSVVTSKSKSLGADVPPEKLRIQIQIAPKESKKKSKAAPDFSNVYSVHAKRQRVAEESKSHPRDVVEEEEVVPPKKMKKKKKKHSKEESPRRVEYDESDALESSAKSTAKTSVLERLGKKVSLDSLEKKEKKKKKSKKNRDIDEDTDDLDLHILKMKAKNEEILRRQREIELDKERYG